MMEMAGNAALGALAGKRRAGCHCTHLPQLWEAHSPRQLQRSLLRHFQERKVRSAAALRSPCSWAGHQVSIARPPDPAAGRRSPPPPPQAAGAPLLPLGEGALCLACSAACPLPKTHPDLNKKLPCPGGWPAAVGRRAGVQAARLLPVPSAAALLPPLILPRTPPDPNSAPSRPARAAGPAHRRAILHRLRRLCV